MSVAGSVLAPMIAQVSAQVIVPRYHSRWSLGMKPRRLLAPLICKAGILPHLWANLPFGWPRPGATLSGVLVRTAMCMTWERLDGEPVVGSASSTSINTAVPGACGAGPDSCALGWANPDGGSAACSELARRGGAGSHRDPEFRRCGEAGSGARWADGRRIETTLPATSKRLGGPLSMIPMRTIAEDRARCGRLHGRREDKLASLVACPYLLDPCEPLLKSLRAAVDIVVENFVDKLAEYRRWRSALRGSPCGPRWCSCVP